MAPVAFSKKSDPHPVGPDEKDIVTVDFGDSKLYCHDGGVQQLKKDGFVDSEAKYFWQSKAWHILGMRGFGCHISRYYKISVEGKNELR